MNIQYKKLYGNQMEIYRNSIAELRMEVFKEYPYLYDGDLEYEAKYLDYYIRSKKSLVVLALVDDHVVGATTCLPMADEDVEVKGPFERGGYNLDSVFYFGESIIRKDFRGNRVGHEFFRMREQHAQESMPNLEWTCFAAVVRPDDHPARPKDYKSLHSFWNRLGYSKDPSLIANLSWKDVGNEHEDLKPLVFWKKKWN